MLAPGRSIAIQRFVDLAVGGIDADLEHLDEHGAARGDAANVRMRLVRQRRDWNVAEMDAVRFTR
jgi:hypothetical protein